MAYPNSHQYLTIHWLNPAAADEMGQVGIRFDSDQVATQDRVNACAPFVNTFWTAANSGIENNFRLSHIKLASIGTDGLYRPDTIAYEFSWGSVAGGGGTTTARFPLQVAFVATFNTAIPRGRASKGRVYLPWYNNALDSTYRWQALDADKRSGTLATMLTGLNTVAGLGNATVFSRVGVGTKQRITSVSHGTRPDIQRRRADQLPDPRQAESSVAAGP